jgi:putative redox protein
MDSQRQARVVWQGEGLEFQAQTGPGYSFTMRSPSNPQGASPMEFLLASVAGCTAMDVISVLHKKRQKVHGLEVKIEGTQAGGSPHVYTTATITYIIQGEDIDPAAVEHAIHLSKTKYCSASIMFERAGVEMTTAYQIEASKSSQANP